MTAPACDDCRHSSVYVSSHMMSDRLICRRLPWRPSTVFERDRDIEKNRPMAWPKCGPAGVYFKPKPSGDDHGADTGDGPPGA